MVNTDLQRHIEDVLSIYLQQTASVLRIQVIHGGDINDAYRLETDAGTFFLKTNSASKYPQMFEQESIGLGALRSSNTIKIPEVIAFENVNDTAYLLLEWIEQGSPIENFWDTFGVQLAQLHQNTGSQFGWSQKNYIGSLVQQNQWTASWSDFFILQRLEPQLNLTLEQGKMDVKHSKLFEKLFYKLDNLFPTESPALLHGDLWSGNYMVDSAGVPVIMDPAVYFGHREMDLAMTKLFGGFDAQLYSSYQEVFPLENNWEERVPLCNLYPLMVHVNLFGGGYVSQVESVLRRFV